MNKFKACKGCKNRVHSITSKLWLHFTESRKFRKILIKK